MNSINCQTNLCDPIRELGKVTLHCIFLLLCQSLVDVEDLTGKGLEISSSCA